MAVKLSRAPFTPVIQNGGRYDAGSGSEAERCIESTNSNSEERKKRKKQVAVGLVKVNTRTKGNRTKPATWKQRSERREEASRVALTNAHSSLALCSSLARALLISSACWNVTWNGTSPRSSLQANWKRSNRKRTLTPFSLHPSSLYLSLSSSCSSSSSSLCSLSSLQHSRSLSVPSVPPTRPSRSGLA